MLKHLSAGNNIETLILLAVILLIAVSPLGNEGTHPLVLFAYRSLLFLITILCSVEIYRRQALEVSSRFLLAGALLFVLMWAGFHFNSGSVFDGRYVFDQLLLFGIAFVALAITNHHRPTAWKYTILVSVVTINLTFVLVELARGTRPAAGTFVNANYFASFLLVGLATCAAVAMFSSNRSIQIASLLAGGILFYGMTAALSRGAVLSAFVIAGCGLWRTGRRSRFVLGTGGLVLIAALAATNSGLIRKFFDRGEFDPYNYARVKVWTGTLRMIGEYPFTGVGLGQFDQASIRFSPAIEGTIGRYAKHIGIAHSEYLQYIAELGAPTALIMFGLAGYLFCLAVRRARQTEGEHARVFQEAAILTAVGLGAHALVDNNWRVPVMAAGLVVFSVGDVLPRRAWNLRIPMSRSMLALAAMIVLGLYVQAVLIPSVGLAFNEMGHRAFEAGDLDRAESLHGLAAGLLPDAPVLLDNLGMVYFDRFVQTSEKRFLDDAERLYRKAIAADPHAPGLKRHLEATFIQKLTGDAERDLITHRQIIEIDRAILVSDPFNPFVRGNLAEALYNTGERKAAEEEMIKAIEIEPNYVTGHLRLAEWCRQAGDTTRSDKHRNRAMSIVAEYRNVTEPAHYEALLLGRPANGSEVKP